MKGMHVDPYEKKFIYIGIVVLVIFFSAITVAGVMLGIQVPSPSQLIDPNTAAISGPYSEPGLQELSPGNYELYIRAEASPWKFYPDEVTGLTVGDKVTFHVTSVDVQHGFKMIGADRADGSRTPDTNINFMVLPGQESTLTYTFKEAGTYFYVCTEYCGVGHQNMFGTIIVE
ncbi:MAG: cytochrome C oxidase subunit II [Anaerolineae bacterium]|mgnify:CR=1 FL=1|jgi:cytochrome c oxidase subunit II|nr:cytochrome C oxidase subunit II [Anaerolineae bacterium]MBT7076012.1 cytochrome C oxidase subunit II [Anaerolineae bacterium]